MMAIVTVLLYGFLLGLRRGLSSCLALCVPSLIPTLIEDGVNAKAGMRIALWFNLPRIVMLTLLGAAIGAGGYLVGSYTGLADPGTASWYIGYGIVGILMFLYGMHVISSADKRLEDIDSGKLSEHDCTPAHPILSRFRFMTPKTRTGLLLWGGIVSLACIGETVLSLETLLVGVSMSQFSSVLAGAILGSAAFFIFSIGASLPSIVFAGLGSNLAQREKRVRRLMEIERVSGVLMVIIGAIYASVVGMALLF
jgi:hypothetical protein